MFELASAIFSIADANEFRFARFYIVCEAAALAPLGRSLIVCGVSDTAGGVFKLGKTRIIRDVKRGVIRNTGFYDQKNRRPL